MPAPYGDIKNNIKMTVKVIGYIVFTEGIIASLAKHFYQYTGLIVGGNITSLVMFRL